MARDETRAPEASRLAAGFDVTGRLALESRCVLRDAYDDHAFQSSLIENSRLSRCSRRGETKLNSFPALLAYVIDHMIGAPIFYPATEEEACRFCEYESVCRFSLA